MINREQFHVSGKPITITLTANPFSWYQLQTKILVIPMRKLWVELTWKIFFSFICLVQPTSLQESFFYKQKNLTSKNKYGRLILKEYSIKLTIDYILMLPIIENDWHHVCDGTLDEINLEMSFQHYFISFVIRSSEVVLLFFRTIRCELQNEICDTFINRELKRH